MAANVHGSVLSSLPATSVLGVDQTDRLTAVTVSGDGVSVYDTRVQSLSASYPLGGVSRLEFVVPAVINTAQEACLAVISDVQSSAHKLVSWPAALSSRKRRGQKDAGFTTVADVPEAIPLPNKALGLHVLYPPMPAAAAGTPPVHEAVAAVALQDGRVGFCSSNATQVSVVGPAAGTPKPRSSCATQDRLYVIHQASAGAQAVLHEYVASYSSASGCSLHHSRSTQIACPHQAALVRTLHASPSYLLLSWSTGDVTVVKGINSSSITSKHVPVQAPGGTSQQPTATPGSKRKASQQATDTSSQTTAAAIVDDSQFLVGSLSFTSDSPTSNPQLHYVLTDHQFGCTVGSGVITLEGVTMPPLSSAVSLKLFSSAAVPGQLIAQVGGTIVLLTVQAKPANLLALLGKLSVSKAAGEPSAKVLNVPALVQLVSAQAATAESKSGNTADELGLQQLPTDPASQLVAESQPTSAQQLVSQLRQAAQADQVAPDSVLQQALDLALGQLQQQLQANSPRSPGGSQAGAHSTSAPWLVHTQLTPLLALALSKAERWAQLEQLLQAVQHQSLLGCGSLLACAARAAQYGLMQRLCSVLDEVTADQLVGVLDVLLTASPSPEAKAQRVEHYNQLRSAAESAIAHAEQQVAHVAPGSAQQDSDAQVAGRREALALAQVAAAAVDAFTPAQVLLHAPMSLHMDAPSLAGALRRLSNTQVDRLLRYLAVWADKHTNTLSLAAGLTPVQLPHHLLTPNSTQVFEWVRLLVDAHLPRLLMSKRQPASLAQLMDLVTTQVKSCQQLMPLAGAVEHVRAGAPLPASHVSVASQYTVQYIDLNIKAAS